MITLEGDFHEERRTLPVLMSHLRHINKLVRGRSGVQEPHLDPTTGPGLEGRRTSLRISLYDSPSSSGFVKKRNTLLTQHTLPVGPPSPGPVEPREKLSPAPSSPEISGQIRHGKRNSCDS